MATVSSCERGHVAAVATVCRGQSCTAAASARPRSLSKGAVGGIRMQSGKGDTGHPDWRLFSFL